MRTLVRASRWSSCDLSDPRRDLIPTAQRAERWDFGSAEEVRRRSVQHGQEGGAGPKSPRHLTARSRCSTIATSSTRGGAEALGALQQVSRGEKRSLHLACQGAVSAYPGEGLVFNGPSSPRDQPDQARIDARKDSAHSTRASPHKL